MHIITPKYITMHFIISFFIIRVSSNRGLPVHPKEFLGHYEVFFSIDFSVDSTHIKTNSPHFFQV